MLFSNAVAMGEMTGSLGAFGTPRGTVNGVLSNDGTTLSIAISGRFDFSLHELFGELYLRQPSTCTHFVLDLSEMASLDSAALGMLLLMRERLGGERSNITFVGVGSGVRRTFDIANFGGLFEVR